jgi:hypothetical protein
MLMTRGAASVVPAPGATSLPVGATRHEPMRADES